MLMPLGNVGRVTTQVNTPRRDADRYETVLLTANSREASLHFRKEDSVGTVVWALLGCALGWGQADRRRHRRGPGHSNLLRLGLG